MSRIVSWEQMLNFPSNLPKCLKCPCTCFWAGLSSCFHAYINPQVLRPTQQGPPFFSFNSSQINILDYPIKVAHNFVRLEYFFFVYIIIFFYELVCLTTAKVILVMTRMLGNRNTRSNHVLSFGDLHRDTLKTPARSTIKIINVSSILKGSHQTN